MAVTRHPARHPHAWVTIDAQTVPAVIVWWERGHPPIPREWHARVIHPSPDGQPRQALIPAPRVRPA